MALNTKLAILFLLIISTSVKSQTCVIGIVTDSAIYFGADSRTTRYITHGNKIDKIPDSICKIKNVGKYNYINIGRFADIADHIASASLKSEGDFKASVKMFVKIFRDSVLRKLEYYQKNTHVMYSSIVSDSVMSQVIFFGYLRDSIALVHIVFWAKSLPNGSTTIYSKLIPPAERMIAGEIEEIGDLYNKDETWKKGIVSGIDELMEIAAKAHPKQLHYRLI